MQHDLDKMMNRIQNSLGILFSWTSASQLSVTLSVYTLQSILDALDAKKPTEHADSDLFRHVSNENLVETVQELRTELNELQTLVMSLREDVVRLDSIQKQQRKREQWEKHNPYMK